MKKIAYAGWDRLAQLIPALGRPSVRQFVKFGTVGATNTLVDFGLYLLLTHSLHIFYLLANIFSYLIATVNSFYLNRRWTFRSNDPAWHKEMVKFVTVTGIGFGLNEGLLYFFVDRAHFHILTGKIFAVLIVLAWNYLLNRHWTFRKPQLP